LRPIIAGPDGALWINQGNLGQVSRLNIGFEPEVTAHGTTFEARAGHSAERTVATFTDADPNAQPRDYAATISWGDGRTTAGWVRRADDGAFAVRGRHTYLKAGTRKVTVRIRRRGQGPGREGLDHGGRLEVTTPRCPRSTPPGHGR
jgi:hypothetical protein